MKLSSICTVKRFKQAFEKVSDNRGSAGIDGISAQSYAKGLNNRLQRLALEIQCGQYRAKPCKVVHIPKSNGKTRQLSIPTIRDRIVHTAISQSFVPFFEKHFEKCSYGYRPNRSYLHAITQIEKYRDKGFNYVLDADITDYFNNIPHEKLKKELSLYINCNELIDLIFNSFRQMQYSGKQRLFGNTADKGLPQGSPLSPVLANIYLDPLDEALMDKSFKIIRYADDFVVLCKSLPAASQALEITKTILENYGLMLNPEKTRVTDFESGFVFLGHFFIGSFVQAIASKSTKLHETAWQWDDLSITEEKYKHAFSGQAVEEAEINDNNYAQLQQEILDCEAIDTSNQSPQLNLNLISKLRTLYLFKQGSVVHRIGGKLEVRHSGETLQRIPITQIDGIMCFGNIHMTRAVILESFHHELPIIFMSQSGHWQGIIRPQVSMDKKLLNNQLHHHNKPLPLAKKIIESKLQNSLTTIKRYLRYHDEQNNQLTKNLLTINNLKSKIEYCNSIQSLTGIEGSCAKLHFQIMQTILAKDWAFKNRNRRPPTDPINAMLSLGYTILFNNIYALIMHRGLIMELGFLHSSYNKQPALALDMMEPFRSVIVDAVVLKLIKHKHIKPTDFSLQNGACLLSTKAKQIFIAAIEQQLSKQPTYPSLAIKTDYRRIMDLQILLLKQHMMDKSIDFKPFTIW